MKSAIFQKTVLWVGVAWGVVMLGVGGLASFTIGSNDTLLTLTGFALVFVLPLAASIAAWRMARVAGSVLLCSAVAGFSVYLRTGPTFSKYLLESICG